jgi:hypothetical protein
VRAMPTSSALRGGSCAATAQKAQAARHIGPGDAYRIEEVVIIWDLARGRLGIEPRGQSLVGGFEKWSQ